MGLYQSYQQVFVTNSPAILAQGSTVDALAVGQVGILDAKTYTGQTAPTYAKNKALYVVWGTPDVNLGDFGGAPNENEYSKLIKGKLIRKFRSKHAQRGITPLYSVGWSGDVSDTDTLFSNPGESKNLFIKLTGKAIDRLYSTQGLTKVFKTTPAPIGDCDDACAAVKCPDIATQLVDQISKDKDFKKFIRAKALIECSPAPTPPTTATCYIFDVIVCDDGTDRALGNIQAAFPAEKVFVLSRNNAMTTYRVIKDANVAPANYTTTDTFIANCTSCPTGFTFTAQAKVYQIKTPNGTSAANVNAAVTGEIATTLINTDPEFNTFLSTFPVATTDAALQAEFAAAGYIGSLIGIQSAICQQTTPTSYTWAANGTLTKQAKVYRITLADTICGTNRLTELQAAYPLLVVTLVDGAGSCVHTYETSVYSNCYATGCAIESITWVDPAPYQGAFWEPVPVAIDADATCKCGIQLETSFFNTVTGDCAFDAFPYENDVVHIQVSNYDPNFNASPDVPQWKFKQLRQVQYPQGHGQYVRQLEKESKEYDHRSRSYDAVVREVQGYSLQADPNKFYDEYTLEFETKWKTAGGWAEEYSQTFHLVFYVPEGTGQQIETAFNTYVTSAGIQEDGTAI